MKAETRTIDLPPLKWPEASLGFLRIIGHPVLTRKVASLNVLPCGLGAGFHAEDVGDVRA